MGGPRVDRDARERSQPNAPLMRPSRCVHAMARGVAAPGLWARACMILSPHLPASSLHPLNGIQRASLLEKHPNQVLPERGDPCDKGKMAGGRGGSQEGFTEEVALQPRPGGQESGQHWNVRAKSVADTRRSKGHGPRLGCSRKPSV